MSTSIERVYKLDIQGADSVNDLRTAIEQLNEKLKTLNETSKEYKDTLKELIDFQDKLRDAMQGLSETAENVNEISSAVTQINDTTEHFTEVVNSAVTSTDTFDESLFKEAKSVNELRAQVKELQNWLVKLKVGTDDYAKASELAYQKAQKLREVTSVTKERVVELDGSYNALTQRLSILRKQWKEATSDMQRAKFTEEMASINKQLKELDATVGNFQRNVGDYRGALKDVFGDPRKEIRMLREELSHLTVGSEEYNQVLLKMADLTQKQKHFQDQLRFSSSNLEDIWTNMAGVARGVAGAFGALNGIMGLVGDSSDDVQKAMLKTQQLILVINGLGQLEGLKDRIVGLFDGIKGFIGRMGAASQSTKEFGENTAAAATDAERATGAMDAQAGSVAKLAREINNLNDEERESAQVISDEISVRQAKINTLKQENFELLEQYAELKNINAKQEELDANIQKRKENGEEISSLEKELETRKKSIDNLIKESRERRILEGEITEEQAARMANLDTLEDEQSKLFDEIQFREKIIESYKNEKARIDEKIAQGKELTLLEEAINNNYEKRLPELDEELAKLEEEYTERQKTIDVERQKVAVDNEYIAKQKQLNTEYSKLSKWQVLSIAQKKLEISQSKSLMIAQQAEAAGLKKLAATYNAAAVAAKVATVAIKGVKTALISSGIGLLIVGIGEALSRLIDGFKELWRNMTGASAAAAQLNNINNSVTSLTANLDNMRKLWDAFGYSDFKKVTHEVYNLKAAMEEARKAFDYAQKNFKAGSEEVENTLKQLNDVEEKYSDIFIDSLTNLQKFLNEIEKADRQKGMSQLDIDLENTNQKFADAIELVKLWGKEGKLSAEEVDSYIQRLNRDLALQTQMLKDRAASATTGTTKTPTVDKNKEEAEKIYKELVENSKREEQKLKEKYEREKKLLEKYHKDTKLLTEQYYRDLDTLLTQRNKIEYDKWVQHLTDMLNRTESGTAEYMEKEIENLKKIFSVDFGQEYTVPFEQFFNIQELDEFGSKAISITEDIKESMQEMGLDPTNIDDIQTMIDKWYLDKKAIEDAEKALKKFISEQRMLKYETENTNIDEEIEKVLEGIELQYDELESRSMKIFGKETGFYTGLSPEQLQTELDKRYNAMETALQKEYDLWKKASEDEKLVAEDKNAAIKKLNEVMQKQQMLVVRKQIDANNLLIKSYENVSNSMSSIASSLSNILGTVSDVIMNNANAQLEANKISEEAYEEQFRKAKAFQIAQATIDTIAGAVGAFMGITKDTGGWGIAAAAIEAAAVLAAGFAQIAVISSTEPQTSSGGNSGGGGGATTFSLPQVMVDEPQYQQNLTNQSDIEALSNALGRNISDQRVYVVDSDITDAQNRSRKVNVETTF